MSFYARAAEGSTRVWVYPSVSPGGCVAGVYAGIMRPELSDNPKRGPF